MSMVKLILFQVFTAVYSSLLLQNKTKNDWGKCLQLLCLILIMTLLAMDDKTVENTHQLYV